MQIVFNSLFTNLYTHKDTWLLGNLFVIIIIIIIIIGGCTFGRHCKRSHNIFDTQPKALLDKHGIDVQRSPKKVLEELRV